MIKIFLLLLATFNFGLLKASSLTGENCHPEIIFDLESINRLVFELEEVKKLQIANDLVQLCKRAHKQGYNELYSLVNSRPAVKGDIKWWVNPDLNIVTNDLLKLNQEITLFKNPINAFVAEYIAPAKMSDIELLTKESLPRLSHFTLAAGSKAFLSIPFRFRYFDEKYRKEETGQFSQKLQRLIGFLDKGLNDVHRHIAWSALLSKHLGAEAALCILALREVRDKNIDSEDLFEGLTHSQKMNTYMDFLNNSIGVMLGQNFKGSDNKLLEEAERLVERGDAFVLNKKDRLMNSSLLFQ